MLKLHLISIALSFNLFIVLSAVSAQTVDLDDIYVKGNKLSYHGYDVTRSVNERKDVSTATISKGGRVVARFNNGGPSLDFTNVALFSLLGGEMKQLIINQYSGGAHCCATIRIYDLAGPRPRALYDNVRYDVDFGPDLVDIDHDGVYEFTQSVMAFDYFDRMSHADSPFPQMVFKFDRSAGRYVPAGREHAGYLLSDIGKHIDAVEKLNRELTSTRYQDDAGGYDGTLLQVVLQYIYAGREQEGWDFYDREYRLDDKALVKMRVKSQLRKSTVYNFIYGRTNRRGSS